MFNYWNESDLIALDFANSFGEVGKIALGVQDKMPSNLSQVCGPISTGGLNNLNENMKVFSSTIDVLKSVGILLFDQRPLEYCINRIRNNLGDKYSSKDLLNGIYGPLFDSGKISRTYFIYGWRTSEGSLWEYDKCIKNNIKIVYLPKDFEKNGFSKDLDELF